MAELTTAIKQFLIHENIKGSSPHTIRSYANYLKNFVQYVGEIDTEKITLFEIEGFINHLKSKNFSGSTISYSIVAIRCLSIWCFRHNIPMIHKDKLIPPKYHQRESEHMTQDEVHRLLDSMPTNTLILLRNRAIMEFLYSTGLRIGELQQLNRTDIDLQRREFTVMGKGKRPRIVFVSDRAEKWMSAYLAARQDNYPALFANFHFSGDHRLTKESMELIVRTNAQKLFGDRKITPHTFRHSFGTGLLEHGADIRSVQELLGHASITTTQKYTHVTNNRLHSVYQSCHN